MYDKFEALLEANGTTAYKVAKATGVSNSMLSSWKKNRSTPKLATLQLIADYFKVPVSYFYNDTESALGITEQQAQSLGIDTEAVKKELNAQLLDEKAIEIAKKVQKLDSTQQVAIEHIINGLLQGTDKG